MFNAQMTCKELNMTKTLSLSAILNARRAAADKQAARWAKEDAKAAKFQIRTDIDPRIGALINAKGVRYYAYVGGVYRESTPEHLTALLGA